MRGERKLAALRQMTAMGLKMTVNEQRIQEFREAAKELGESDSLVSAFGVGRLGALTGQDATHEDQDIEAKRAHHLDSGKKHREELTLKAHNYAIKSGSDETSIAGLRMNQVSAVGTGAAGGKSASKRAAERAYRDALLHALQANSLGALVADQVFDDMSEAEITDIVAEIEAETGQSLEDYARGILGDDAVERLPDESDADYQKRVLKTITEEIIDPETGKIKPEYANDLLAQVIMGNEAYQQILLDLQDVNESVAKHGKTTETDRIIEAAASKGYSESDVTVLKVEDDDYKSQSKDIQDSQRDQTMDTAEKVDKNAGFFAGVAGPSAADLASTKAVAEFNSVAAPPHAKNADPVQEATPDPASPTPVV